MTYFEQSVIGSVLLTNGKALEDLTLTPADFDDLQNERIYKTMLEMKSARQPIDVLTVGAALPKLASYLHDVVTGTPTASSVKFYANKVIEEATRRRLAVAGTMIHSKAQHEDLASVFDSAKKEIDNLIDRNQAVKPTYVADELLPYLFTALRWAVTSFTTESSLAKLRCTSATLRKEHSRNTTG
jgi:replicative DNA helicase